MPVTEFVAPAGIAFVAGVIIALLLTPLARRLATWADALDRPDARRVNTAPVPRGGGLAVAAAFVLVAGGALVADAIWGIWPGFGDRLQVSQVVALLGGGALAALLGTLDDWFDLRARWQLLGQLAVAGVAVLLGITVGAFANPFGSESIHLTGVFAIGFTVFWIVGMINSINFIDGLDGLSSGIGAIAAVTLGVISFTGSVEQPAVAVMCLALAGALFGFLKWNWHPATIFAGTSGVMFLGYTLAVLSILGAAKVAVALLVLGVPIIDTFFIIVRRIARGRSPFSPDRGHFHHRLLDVGLSHKQTVVLIYAICGGLGGLSLVLSGTGQTLAFVGAVVLGGLLIFLLDRTVAEVEEDLESGAGEVSAPASPTGPAGLVLSDPVGPLLGQPASGAPRRPEQLPASPSRPVASAPVAPARPETSAPRASHSAALHAAAPAGPTMRSGAATPADEDRQPH